MSLTVRYLPDFAEFTLDGSIQASLIYPLCQAVDSAITSLHYEKLRILIESAGGETKILRFLLAKQEHWYRCGITIETEGMSSCASAAAILLSMGSRGHRRADQRYCRPLYHFARLSADAVLKREADRYESGLTARAGAAVAKQLVEYQSLVKRDDDFIIDVLMSHICGGLISKPDNWFAEEFLRRKYHLQQHHDQMISEAAQSACHWSDRDEKSIRILWDQLYRETHSPDVAAAFLEVELRTMLDQDRNCSPLEAWMLFLIDDFGGTKNV